MGLDMYLTAKRYLWTHGDHPDGAIATAIATHFPEIGDKRVKQVEVEAMYWRKANAIHLWFVKNVQDGVDECQEAEVSRDDLRKLHDVIGQVLADNSLAASLLQGGAGFFFGPTDYDDWYFTTLKRTHVELQELLQDKWDNWDFYYRASW